MVQLIQNIIEPSRDASTSSTFKLLHLAHRYLMILANHSFPLSRAMESGALVFRSG